MSHYRVYLNTTASTVITVDADSPEEAEDLALDGDLPSLCAYCVGIGQSHNLDMYGDWELDPAGPELIKETA